MSSYLSTFINLLFNILSLAIFARVILSWIDPMGNLRLTHLLHAVTEPILAPIRSVLPNTMMFDFSPIIAMLILQALSQLILGAIR